MTLSLYNSFTKRTEPFKPIRSDYVTLYSCGPTVYDYAHIGNFRSFFLADFVYRTLVFNGYNVRYIMNLTDVGHLTDDADQGDDKLELAAEKERKSAREIADFYIKHFINDYDKLGLSRPLKFTRATDYIQEQIELVRALEVRGFTYKTEDGIYFDTSKFPAYGQMSGLTLTNTQREERINENSQKRNSSDFALWKFSPENSKRWQQWQSPWGMGFPGWHVECSAMSMRELGASIDVHTGGEDHKMIHHPNEIAQSECSTGQKFVNYWLHSSFMRVNDERMGKSNKNIFTIADVEAKGFTPLAVRYFYMSAHYRTPTNFTWGALQSAQNALKKLYSVVEGYRDRQGAQPDEETLSNFLTAINDDLNTPKALSVTWELLKGDLPEEVKLITLLKIDEVLGLNINQHVGLEIPKKITDLAETRFQYRKNGIWDKADIIRREIEENGYVIDDSASGYKVRKKIS